MPSSHDPALTPLPRRRVVTLLLAGGAGLVALGRPAWTRAAAGEPLRIGVIGAGWLGGTVGRLLVRAGHEVLFSSRHPDELRAMASSQGPRATVGTPKEAATFGSVLLFAVPYDAIPQLGRDLQAELPGKIVLDACNGTTGALGAEAQANGDGPTTAKYLPGARVVRVFSSEDATAIEASAGRATGKLGIPLAGDDAAARRVAAQLVREAGCEPIEVGNLAAAVKFQSGTPAFRTNLTAAELRRRLGLASN